MLKKTIQYTNFEGNTITEDAYFHLFLDDAISLYDDGVQNDFETLENANAKLADKKSALDRVFHKAYGHRVTDEDGNVSFEHYEDDKAWNRFRTSGAYDEFIAEVLFSGNVQQVLDSILPPALRNAANKASQNNN